MSIKNTTIDISHTPINPVDIPKSMDDKGNIIDRDIYLGLTVRQHFASIFMQTIMSYSKDSISNQAKSAIIAADELIRQLQ